ncbi:amidohydrolase family protein [Pseudocolwellia sp. HL-MZ19]
MKIAQRLKSWGIKTLALSTATGLMAINPAYAAEEFYSLNDFLAVNKIDAHVHTNSSNSAFIELAIKNNFKLLSINVDYPDFPGIDKQLAITTEFKAQHPNVLAFASTFSMRDWNDEQWGSNVITSLKSSFDKGAVAVKVWKNIGMDFRDKNNALIQLNNSKLTPIFNFLSDQGVPLIGHQAEPKNCWLPVSEMTVTNDQQYFTNHPQYHMYLHPELPSYEDHMHIRNEVLSNYPKLNFVGAHLASIEWSVDELAKFLDRFPLATVDMAARMGQIQYQSKRGYNKVRNFFIKYQDRLLYATDLTHQPQEPISESSAKSFASDVEKRWRSDWEYLTSANEMTTIEVEGNFKGLHLPKKIINKIYETNALKTYKNAFKE